MSTAKNTDELITIAVACAKRAKLVDTDDLVIITAGVPIGVSGSTNIIKAHVVDDPSFEGLIL